MATNTVYIGDVGRTKEIRHDELKEGMLNWRSGHLLKVTELRKSPQFNEYKQRIEIMVHFTGVPVDDNNELYHTSCNGARYDAWGWYPAIIKIDGGPHGS